MAAASDLAWLRELIAEYGRLTSLEGGLTPQARGQRFNGLLAEMFNAWGLRAQADLNVAGNIDVAFAVDSTRFVLEAKWEAPPVDTGAIAKLRTRVVQRLGGTIGVFVSMSGYSPAALADVKDGQRLEVILLDRHHVEAMLSGLCPPEELLEGVLDGAHFLGDAYTSLENVLCTTPRPLDAIFGPAPELPTPITFAADGATAEVVLRNLPFGHLGIAATGRGRLVITTGDGLYDIDLVKGAATPRRAPLGIDRPAVRKLATAHDRRGSAREARETTG